MLAALIAFSVFALGTSAAAPLALTGPSFDAGTELELSRIAAAGPLSHDLAARRAAFDRLAKDVAGVPETVMRVEDLMVGDVRIRLYRPGEGRVPAIIYTHGGGFDKGGLDSHDGVLRLLANRCHCVILSVDYRLAPEHKYPAQIDDAYAVLRWAAANARSLEIEPDKFVVAGDGAGGNLAALLALRARDEGGPKIIYQALFYPVTDLSFASQSGKLREGSPAPSADYDANELHAWHLPTGLDAKDARVSPLYADLRALPQAFVAVAELDRHRGDGRAYAKKLQDARVQAEAKAYGNRSRDFLLISSKANRQLIDDFAARLRQVFGYVE